MDIQLVRFYRQYMQQVHTLTYPSGKLLLMPYIQDQLYKHFFNGPLKGPPAYQRNVLKRIIMLIEKQIEDAEEDEVSDDLAEHMAYLSTQPQLPPEQAAFETQILTYIPPVALDHPDPPRILIEETPNLLAAGSNVGLRTWEASLRLATYLHSNAELVRHKTILELGSGTGLAAILCAGVLDAAYVRVTDGLPHVVENLEKNIARNTVSGLLRSDRRLIRAAVLDWADTQGLKDTLSADDDENDDDDDDNDEAERQYDVFLGADITYSPEVVPILAELLKLLLEIYPHAQAIVSATVRNERTWQIFCVSCQRKGLKMEQIIFECPGMGGQKGFFHEQAFPMVLVRISKET